eukprot:GHVL01032851.1.p1 GENE.GHVL01032851.1~~GHVL01032851.1.p1  ORF type:complete len:115 (-),score=1.78 GHVL01032851.1:1-345(-)
MMSHAARGPPKKVVRLDTSVATCSTMRGDPACRDEKISSTDSFMQAQKDIEFLKRHTAELLTTSHKVKLEFLPGLDIPHKPCTNNPSPDAIRIFQEYVRLGVVKLLTNNDVSTV